MEDKKCRVCGQADMNNINIFNSTKLPEKIAAVYPIPLYPNDPLPKHICKKCVVSTVNMYNMIERALLNQTKWIANIRSVQPENQYLKVVDSIAGANKQTSQLVSLIAGSEIGERTICKLFNFKAETLLPNQISSCKPTVTFNNHLPEPGKTKEDGEQPTNCIPAESERAKIQKQAQASPSNSREHPHPKITQMKSVLEQNGCTLTKLKPTTIKSFPGSQKNDIIEEIKVEIKEEPLEEYHPVHIEPTELQSQPIVEDHQVSCKMCRFSCETIEELAIHQLNHLSICSIKLSERRFLDKRIRRGRLIVIESKKCIRCLNCWRIFSDNKSILQHWSEGDCDFFCQICGKEFATSPKMLREHIPAAHGISYRSSKSLRPPTLVPSKTIKTEKTTAKSSVKSPVKTPVKSPVKSSPVKKEQLSITPSKTSPSFKKKPIPNNGILTVKVACGICLKVFANFKARNSHMRAHKHPPFLPDKPPPSLSETLMALNRTDMLQIKDEPLEYDNIPSYQSEFSNVTPAIAPAPAPIIFPSTSGPALNQPPIKHPRLKVIPSRPPTGARKKILQMRPNPSQSVIKSEPGLMSVGPLQVKSLIDLQDPSVSSQLPEEDPNKLYFGTLNPPTALPTPPPPPRDLPSNGTPTPTINGFSMEPDACSAAAATPKDNMIYGQIFTCHPCGEKFNSKLELFRHKRKCTANNLFPCQFCERHFITSADLQMHIMLLHKSTAAQSNLSH